jgi:hypothetical protein
MMFSIVATQMNSSDSICDLALYGGGSQSIRSDSLIGDGFGTEHKANGWTKAPQKKVSRPYGRVEVLIASNNLLGRHSLPRPWAEALASSFSSAKTRVLNGSIFILPRVKGYKSLG